MIELVAAASDPTSLDRLHDIVEPPPVPWWPPAPGWYVVAMIVAIAAIYGAWRGWRHWKANAYRRAALAELAGIATRASTDPAAWLDLPPLVKRTAIVAFGRDDVAALSGSVWLAYLDRTGGTTAFARGPGELLEALAYDPAATRGISNDRITALRSLVDVWIRSHRPPKTMLHE
jgi:hypothetical protein